MSREPRISFGMIVLNGEPFIRYALRALYPFAHEIIVVEGAAPAAASIATADGHSLDDTLQSLRAFQAQEDPEGKLIIVTRAGFWTEKGEMSQAYAQRASGDYLWQVDVDEFYMPRDLQAVRQLLREQPAITAVSFNTLTFWGGLDYRVDAWHHRRGAAEYHRLFKWGAGYRYNSHRPPTVLDAEGRDLRAQHWLRGEAMAARGIRLYHYSLLLPKQVREKCAYYSRAAWARREHASQWAEESYFQLKRPYHLHNVDAYPACLYRYTGAHPPQAQRMWRDITRAGSRYEIRQSADIEALLRSRRYRLGRFFVMRANIPALRLRQLSIKLSAGLARLLPRWLKRLARGISQR